MSNKKIGIAFFQLNANEGVGGGGAGRFFLDVYKEFRKEKSKEFNLFFFLNKENTQLFKETNKEFSSEVYKSIISFKSINNRYKEKVEPLVLLNSILKNNIKLIHICQYFHQDHYHLIKFLQKLPVKIRPKIVVNFIHCNFPYEYNDIEHPHYEIFHKRFDPLFNDLKIDAVYSWYTLFKEFVQENKLFKNEPLIFPITKYCCDTSRFKPGNKKRNIIVFASRLDNQKNPMFFLSAINSIKAEIKRHSFKVLICGKGPLLSNIQKYIIEKGLKSIIEIRTDISDMSPIFANSKCFVSTQNFENFTSLSMNEAILLYFSSYYQA